MVIIIVFFLVIVVVSMVMMPVSLMLPPVTMMFFPSRDAVSVMTISRTFEFVLWPKPRAGIPMLAKWGEQT